MSPVCDNSRVSLSYTNLSEKFHAPKPDYTKQYCRIYTVRIEEMRNLLEKRIEKKWGNDFPISKLHMLSDMTDTCIIIGTLFKNQKLKPSVLKLFAEGIHVLPQPVHQHLTDESDVLYMEDELQRIQLIGNAINANNLVTGISCALLGRNLGRGKFEVDDCCFVDCREQIERPTFNVDYYIAFISGINLRGLTKHRLSLNLFVDWLSGVFNKSNESISPKNVVRLIVAGNTTQMERETKTNAEGNSASKKLEHDDTLQSVMQMDSLLNALVQMIEVDVMPGEFDPSNHVLPQQEIHNCVLPKSSEYKSFNRVTNPYDCSVGGLRIMGTSGQPVHDIMRYSDITEPTDILEECLRWNHLAPTAPDTLGCYPHYSKDPFILQECPHIFFAGNQSKFATKVYKGENGAEVCLISIPEFYSSATVAVVNMRTLKSFPLTFSSSL